MSRKEHRVSKKYAKRYFSTVGLLLILYALFVLILPFVFHAYMDEIDASIMRDEWLYFGIYLIILLFGTMIPFFLMRKTFKIDRRKIYRNINATFVDLFVQTIVCFTACIGLTYVSNIIFVYLGLEGSIISSIGLPIEDSNLGNPLYIFMLLIVTPIIEEYAFRGVLLNTLGKYGKVFGLYVSALIFALAHIDFTEMIPAFAMGVLLGKTSYRYRSIQPTILIHVLFNGLLYALFIIPPVIAEYMAYVLVAIVVFAAYLILTGRYQRIKIQKLHSDKVTILLFFSRFTIILALMLLVADSLLFMFFS